MRLLTRKRPAAPSPESASIQPRILTPEGTTNLAQIGRAENPFGDLYHLWLTAPWRWAVAVVVLAFLGVNALFGVAYFVAGGVEGMREGSFSDAFFFSVQTLSTIGYGRMAPVSLAAHLLVTVESFSGLMGLAMATGLMFAKFARPTARVLWSKVAVVTTHEGVRSLMFRMANQRRNQVVEAQLRVSVVLDERTREGQALRRVHDLKLLRSQSPVFALTWTAIHPITPDSLFYGRSVESLKAARAELMASLTGLDATFGQTIHSRHGYTVDEIVWDARFADVFTELPDGRRAIVYDRFHDTVRLAPEERADATASAERT